MVGVRRFRHRGPSFADLVPYAGLVDNGVMLLKDGSLMAAWYFSGPDSESATNLERNDLNRHLNSVLCRLGSGWMIQVEALRVATQDYPAEGDCFFPDAVTKAIDAERRAHFHASSRHFESRHVLVLTFKPPEPRQSAFSRYLYANARSRSATYADTVLEQFRTDIREIEQYLQSALIIERMVTRSVSEDGGQHIVQFDDLFQFIRFCIAGESHPVRLPSIPMYLDWLATAELQHGLSPLVEGRKLAVVGIDGFPAESWPGILNSLASLPFSYRWSSRFIFLDEQDARARLEHTRRKWRQKVRPFIDQLFQTSARAVDNDALSMVAETEDAIAQAASRLVTYGYYTAVIVLSAQDEQLAREQAETVRRLIQAEGFGARIETLNATDAFLGSLPGNSYANVREPLISSANLVDLIPLNSIWSGSAHAPCPFYPPHSPPLMQVATGSSPFRLNLHVDDVGHTLIFGPTGSGKSTLLALIAAQFRRYEHAQIFAFEKGRSLLPLTLAAEGHHYEIGAEEDNAALSFCPLAELDTDSDRAWATGWIEALIALQGVGVTPAMRNAIAHQIGLMALTTSRSLSDFVSGVQMLDVKEALAAYTLDGPMGRLLDAEADSLRLGTFQTFEIEELMSLGERNLVPVLLYLFRRIEKRLTGAPSLIILDEAWLMLGHGVFREKIREWLKTLRKANCAVVLATQSISDAERSGIIDVLKESCPTKICLPNSAAQEPGTCEFYRRLGFNKRQLELIASAIPKRDYYVSSPAGRRMFDMALGPLTIAFAGASSRQHLNRIKALRAEYGRSWPAKWLAERGVEDAHELLA